MKGDAKMSVRTTGCVWVVFLWSVTVVLGQDVWGVTYSTQSICVLKGSTVELKATYTYPGGHKVTSTFWFINNDADGNPVNLMDDLVFRDHVTYRSDEKNEHILTITDLRETDSAEYKFRLITDQPGGKYAGRPGVTLTVTGLQVNMAGENIGKTVTCRTICPLSGNPTYIWYKNGQHIDESTSPQYKDSVYSNYGDSYSCAVKGHEDLHSPLVCFPGQYCNRVSYTNRRICVLKGSSVDISCTYVGYYPVTSSLWFSPKQSGRWRDMLIPEDLTTDPGYAGRVKYSDQESRRYGGPSTLRITDVREEDSADYRFTFKTENNFEWGQSLPGTTLSVTGLRVEVTNKGGRQNVTLTCSSTCPLPGNPTYIWYKNGQHIDESTSPQYKDSVYSNYEDSYSCAVKGHEDLHSPVVCVQGQDCSRVIYTNRRICVLKGSSVDISCTYDGYNAVTSSLWFSLKQSGRWRDTLIPEDLTTDPVYAGRVEYPDQESRRYRGPFTLRITDVIEEDSAEYRFTFKTENNFTWGQSLPGTTLTVTALQVDVKSKTLTCSTTCHLPGNITYIWYKNGQHIDESTSPQYKDSVYSNYEDSYSCAVKGHEDLHSTVVCVHGQDCNRVSYTKRRICVLKGSSVDISCTYAGYYYVTSSLWFSPKLSGRWRDKLIPEDLTTDPGYAGRVEYPDQESTGYRGPSTLRITDVKEEDSAEYRFTFKTNYNFEWGQSLHGTILTVTGLQVKMTPPTCNEGQNVTLTCSSMCSLNDNPTYTWYKKNVTSLKASGQSYSITNITSEDSGEYYCEAENEYGHLNSSNLCVDVHYSPKNTSISISLSGEIMEGSSVTLNCSSDANPPVNKYTWYKKNVASPKASGQSYNITNIRSEDSGEYYCEAENVITFGKSPALTIIITEKKTASRTAAVGVTVVVLVLILCLSAFIWFRMKSSKSTPDTRNTADDGQEVLGPVYDIVSSVEMTSNGAQRADKDNQEDLNYASVHFSSSKGQDEPLYSTALLSQHQKEEEDVQYAAVKFSAAPRMTTQEVEEDPFMIYSTVNEQHC
ncbi:hypothetical protein UPYG_G00060350 [Umbra pygmaea]|uniref:Ig-like domain-containing protein n=1 Tax=Umbra pygmaea TaxID=75934 RepID=A0ABD0X971_UMBPY